VVKIHRDRDIGDALDFTEYQRLAEQCRACTSDEDDQVKEVWLTQLHLSMGADHLSVETCSPGTSTSGPHTSAHSSEGSTTHRSAEEAAGNIHLVVATTARYLAEMDKALLWDFQLWRRYAVSLNYLMRKKGTNFDDPSEADAELDNEIAEFESLEREDGEELRRKLANRRSLSAVLNPSELVPFRLPVISKFVNTLEDGAEFVVCGSRY